MQRVPPKPPVVAQTEPAPAPRQQVAMVTAPKGALEPAQDVKPVATEVLRDCLHCPEMIKLAGGTFIMGSNNDRTERPVRSVAVAPFALGRYPVTVGEWKFCVAAKACSYEPTGADDQPVRNISWNDAQQYVGWLSKVTKQNYRLPTEAEWEYAARANTTTAYWWGTQMVDGMANCKGCGGAYDASQPLKVGSFKANPFGLHDMTGGIAQWVADCWHPDYQGAPANGAAREMANCREHVLRGGSWKNDPSYLTASSRDHYDTGVRYHTHGLRVARAP
jgi:formylglycine-generating enzyme required for sulfatase activity